MEQGGRVREHLREGVEACIRQLAAGFLDHPANEALRRRIETPPPLAGGGRGEGSGQDVGGPRHDRISPENRYRQLLKLIYRLLFLLVAEDRGLLSPDPLYREHYGIGRLRRLVDRRAAFDDYDDLWRSLCVLWRVLTKEELAATLRLPPLNGELFAPVDLDEATIANRDLLRALWHLVYYQERAAPPRRVNYAALDVEELGSVYESLLEFHPAIDPDPAGRPMFALLPGSERKTTGSYYTPPELVAELIKSALEPVLAERLATAPPERREAALLAITVCDPACGSGHFLLAAARRLGKELAKLRTGADEPAPERVREAIRDVIGHCIYGVDKNPLAVDLCRVALWLESHVSDRPLTFLDRRIRVGDSLVGVFDLKVLGRGIPDEAFKPLEGDDKATARRLMRQNRHERQGQRTLLAWKPDETLAAFSEAGTRIEAIGDDTPEAVRRKSALFRARYSDPAWVREKEACDLWTAAFFQELAPDAPAITSDVVLGRLDGREAPPQIKTIATVLEHENRFFHWPLEFPEIFAVGGFHVVVGNPPWERIKLQEQEFFAAHDRAIADALNAAVRGRMITALARAAEGTRERALSAALVAAKRQAQAASIFARQSGRFLRTGQGDINTYALFAEQATALVHPCGRAGVIVPTGIATDATTAPFFSDLIEGRRLCSLHDVQTGLGFFDRIGHARFKFCLLTICAAGSGPSQPSFSFFSRTAGELADPRRRFTLCPTDIARINPNTRTAPIFRSIRNAEMTEKIHARVPVLIEEAKGAPGNPWGLSFMAMFHMANDSSVFHTAAQLGRAGFARDGTDWVRAMERHVPLYEAKMIHQFDHRWATYDGKDSRDVVTAEKQDPAFESEPRYWIPEREFLSRLVARNWNKGWLIGWRDICRSTDERTVIATAFPKVAMGHTMPLFFSDVDAPLKSGLCANLNSLVLDYVARQKLGGTHLTFGYLNQFPILPPAAYSESDLAFIVPRILELTYTSHSMARFARDLGYDGPPFTWNEGRRGVLRAELDAFYAHAYGLTRDELRYILDPEDVMGFGYPSETFRVLKQNDIRRFGEYRTARLVLAAYDAPTAIGLAAQ